MFLATPERLQAAMHTQLQAVADFNKRVADWQLGQIALAEKQLSANMSFGSRAIEATVEAATAMQTQLLDTVTADEA